MDGVPRRCSGGFLSVGAPVYEEGEPDQLVLTHLYRDPKLPPLLAQISAKVYFPWALGKVLGNEKVCFRNPAELPREAAQDMVSFQQFGIEAGLAIPLAIPGRPPTGALSLESSRGERDWPEPLQERLQLIASVFANALDRKIAGQKLVESETRLTLAAHAANAGLWTLDVTNGKFWLTATTLKLIGLQPDEHFDYETFLGMLHHEDSVAVQRIIAEAMLTGEESLIDYRIIRIIRPDGACAG